LVLPNFFEVFQGNLLALVILSSPLGSSSIDVFQNWVWMGYVLLPHVSCYYTGILLLIIHIMLQKYFNLLDWFILFDHWFEDDMLLIMFSSYPIYLLDLPWILKQTGVFYHWESSIVLHIIFKFHLNKFLQFALMISLYLLSWVWSSLKIDPLLLIHYYYNYVLVIWF